MKINSIYSDKQRVISDCTGKSRTKQSFKEECDINNILKRYEKNGVLPSMIKKNPQYGDFSTVPEYSESLMIIKRAEEQFNALPSVVRARFKNDPANFLEFVGKKENAEEMVKMGLATKKEITEVEKVVNEVVNNAESKKAEAVKK